MERRCDAGAEAVWQLLVQVDQWPRWGPSVRAVHLDGDRIEAGSAGRVETVGGVVLPFEVTELVEGRSWAWRVAGVEATDHLVEPDGDGCRIAFGVPWAYAPYLAVCAVALRRLDRLARVGSPEGGVNGPG